MFWRDRALEHGEPKKRALEQLVRSGRHTGLVAYAGTEPVGWVAVAPREEHEVLLRSPQLRPRDRDEGVWAIVCFTVDRSARGRGVRRVLLDAAVAHACSRGARWIEAYPHSTKSDDYMGGLDVFVTHGFAVTRVASKRSVVRRRCSP